MSTQPTGQEKRRIFEVAKELKLMTPTIIKFLEAHGYDVSRKQMSPISEEMYVELLHKFDRTRYLQYQSEHSTEREAVQKRDYERLRREEQDRILAVKEDSTDESEEISTKKVELPRYREFVIQKAKPRKATEKAGVLAGEDVDEIRTDVLREDATTEKAAVEKKTQAVVSADDRLPRKKTGQVVSADTETAQIVEKKKDGIVRLPAGREVAETERRLAVDKKFKHPRKIELPELKSLKIAEEAPAKDVEKPARVGGKETADEALADRKDKRKLVTVARTPVEPEERKQVVAEGETRTGKRRLKRKRVAIKPENVEDALETEQEVQLHRELEKQAKQKPVKVEVAEAKPARRKRRRKLKTTEAASAPLAKPSKRKKRQQVSATEVSATIKETMAKIDGRGKGRRHHSAANKLLSSEAGPLALRVTEFITTQELANLLEIPFKEIITKCLSMGMIISINQRLDKDIIELLAAEYEVDVEFITDDDITEDEDVESIVNLEKRSPVVTIMGHVDHGKTTLLDYLRKTRVAEGEVGGITQHIGAYEVEYSGQRVTFLDTPGHEAFTAMRARGAQITDIVVLVVAADDKVMPQTIEAIDHARAAGTSIVVAINKIDKPGANPESIYKQLADKNILVEKWGGNYQSAEISAKFGQGVDRLLAEILVATDILELKAQLTGNARGVIVESRLDKGLGAVATILVQSGTLKLGDPIVVGESYGRVRVMYDERGIKRDTAGPSTPVQVIGFNGIPQAGDKMTVFDTEKEARDVSLRRQRQHREISARRIRSLTLEQASKQMLAAEMSVLPLIIKGDVHGSVEVLSDALMRLSTSEVKVEIIHSGVGGITESDVLLSAASNAIIIGFHVHPNIQARELARREGVEIKLYRIIHEVVDEIRRSLEGLLAPSKEEKVIGTLEIRQVFKISRLGTIGGSYVVDGKISRHSKVRLIRDDVEVWSGELASLKRFKEDVKEISAGFECGVALNGYRDIRENDKLQVFEIIETKRKLGTQN